MLGFTRTTSHGGISIRRIFIFTLATVVATFLWALIATTPPSVQAIDNPTTNPNVPGLVNGQTTNQTTNTTNGQTTSNTTNATTNDETPGTSSCVVEGIGWIVCPVTKFLASGLDWVFKIVSGFLEIRQVSSDQNTALYRAWTYMRSFANVAFVIAFLIIISSQVTNYGISNYGIKKLLPRLIIAAILVNLSYYICALLVDVSNILGYSFQDIFISMRNNLVGAEGNNWDVISAESVTGFVLSGGAVAAATGIGIAGGVIALSTYGLVGSIFLLVPSIMVCVLAVLVALVVMASRQALVTILIVLAPLAFVAYLLPNTEKWFEKWKSTLTTMLILFPAFSIIFGGSQLAAAVIIQNADSINLIILGMLVQVAPLFITPLLIKFSGSLLGKVAGFVNNPAKGPIDRTRKFIEDRTGNIAAKRLGQPAQRWQVLQRNAQRRDANRRTREGQKAAYGNMTDARWSNSSRFRAIDQQVKEAQDSKAVGEGLSGLEYSIAKSTDHTRAQSLDNRLREIKLKNDIANLQVDNNWSNYGNAPFSEERLKFRVLTDENSLLKIKSDAEYEVKKTKKYNDTAAYSKLSGDMKGLIERAQVTAESLSISAMRNKSAKDVQQYELVKALENNVVRDGVNLREEAGAYSIDPSGAERARAVAISVISKVDAERMNNAKTIIESGNPSAALKLRLAQGHNITTDNGHTILATDDNVAAAIDMVASGGFVQNIIELAESMDLSKGGATPEEQETKEARRVVFSEALQKNAKNGRSAFFGYGWLGKITQGVDENPYDREHRIDILIRNLLNEQDLPASTLVTQDKEALMRIRDTIATHKNDPKYFKNGALEVLKNEIATVFNTPDLDSKLGERRKFLVEIDNLL